MNQIDTKPRIRRKAEVTPPHRVAAPKNAPKCYGDPQARILNPDCTCCAVRDRCAEFIGHGFVLAVTLPAPCALQDSGVTKSCQ